MTVSFESLARPPGVEIRDRIERRSFALHTSGRPDPRPVATDDFAFPVDAAVAVTTDRVVLPQVVVGYVRDDEGSMEQEIVNGTSRELPPGRYDVELCAPMKVYLRVESGISVAADRDRVRLDFAPETEVRVGARSHHERPEATVTTTADPRDVMKAVSTFGSALKTTSPERSFPTLRGHPPLVELGDELRIPPELDVPETGIRLELPPEHRYVFVAAPLAFYLGAEVVPGSTPRLVTESGFAYDLDGPEGYERAVERTLKRTFLLDCLVRTEGYYEVDLHERTEIEPLVDLDFAALYDAPLAERIEAYLSVPWSVVADHVPAWKLTTHVTPTAENVESLPFVVNDLAVVRTPSLRTRSLPRQSDVIGEFARDSEFTRSTADSSAEIPVVRPERSDSVEEAWIGDHAPMDASKATTAAFRNRLSRDVSAETVDITVVCNDTEMGDERDLAAEVYGSRENLPFDVTVRRDLTTDELRAVLETEAAFLHYIGHIGEEGFRCADGHLDATTLESVGVEAFILNACRSYEQGLALVEAGSVGGVVTLSDVINSGAVRVGKTMVRLLNRGFPLRAALSIARGRSIVGNRYIVVGDGNVDVVQTESGLAVLLDVDTEGTDFEVTPRTHVANQGGMGGFFTPHVGGDEYHLVSGEHGPFSLTREELALTLSAENVPVRIDGEFAWSRSIDVDSL
ncbi:MULTISPECIES: CHAT domain-containing protein [Halorussus]|uniref:CHAT domain-containing protein n=1 Tax=Halorussus TaxID=1070314 RepID=UPI00209F143E|nr:CHAT domain-containing protein [Halorussus vallis]USZ76241.1 CHAT domain-containing protein [Halorussus vallis]